jgi:hypothetical protein
MIKGSGVAWYTPASWRQLQAVAGDTLCTYAEFKRKTEAIVCGFGVRGIKAQKVAIDVDHMAAWCKRHSYPIGASSSRSAYGAVLMAMNGELFDLDTPFDDGGQMVRQQ